MKVPQVAGQPKPERYAGGDSIAAAVKKASYAADRLAEGYVGDQNISRFP